MNNSPPGFLAVDELRLLGEGSEAEVYTDGKSVFKIFKPSPDMITYEQASEISARINSYAQPRFFYPLTLLGDGSAKEPLVFKYSFEKSKPYTGGLAQDMAGFLLEARSMGIVLRNVHPKNFIVAESGLRFIDYGRDMRLYNENDFRQMAVRAWLSMRCWYRVDIKDLMRAALYSQDMPELAGFDGYYKALCAADKNSRFLPVPSFFSPKPPGLELNPYIIGKVLEQNPRTILDYGCGKGKLADTLAERGLQVVGWDPDASAIEANRKRESPVVYEYSLKEYIENKICFDAIVCSKVLCFIDDAEAVRAMKNLRRLASECGKIYLAICNPFFNGRKKLKYHYKEPAPNFSYWGNSALQAISPYTGKEFKDYHRPLEWYVRELGKHGFSVTEIYESSGLNPENGRAFSDYLILELATVALPTAKATLIIRACALEWDTIEIQVRHITRQLAASPYVANVFLQVDTRTDDFTRSHGEPNLPLLLERIDKLRALGLIDDIIFPPRAENELRQLNQRWFGLDSAALCSEKKEPSLGSLNAFEKSPNEYIVAVDADVMLLKNNGHDPIKEAVELLEAHPKAITASLNIVKREDTPLQARNMAGQNHRVEVRAGVFHKERLLRARPFNNSINNGFLALTWYRALDQALYEKGGESWRGGSRLSAFVHPPNTCKSDRFAWFEVLDRLEAGYVPLAQYGAVDLCGTGAEWYGPKRPEPFVFVMNGRNVEPDRLKRCIDSLKIQEGPEWGAVIIDDASDDGSAGYLEILCRPLKKRITLIKNRVRCGQLPNIVKAVKHYVTDDNSVILTLDNDDALIGAHALATVAEAYANGADMTVGSMLRTDKPEIRYKVDFDNPRRNRGGNVWSHLRTFKKYLFDAIKPEDMQIGGQWIETANDWAFMLPITEMAANPVFIEQLLYLYEPSADKHFRGGPNQALREDIIGTIVAKPAYSKLERRGRV